MRKHPVLSSLLVFSLISRCCCQAQAASPSKEAQQPFSSPLKGLSLEARRPLVSPDDFPWPTLFWPDGLVPISIDPSMRLRNRALVKAMVGLITDGWLSGPDLVPTCLRFPFLEAEPSSQGTTSYLYFTDSAHENCSSSMGRVGGKVVINIGVACTRASSNQHHPMTQLLSALNIMWVPDNLQAMIRRLADAYHCHKHLAAPTCPPNWIQAAGGGCYHVFTHSDTYDRARTKCDNHAAHLFHIPSSPPEIQELIELFFNGDHPLPHHRRPEPLWIGAGAGGDEFYWDYGKAQAPVLVRDTLLRLRFIHASLSRYYGSSDSEPTALVWTATNGSLKNSNIATAVTDKQAFICEKARKAPPPSTKEAPHYHHQVQTSIDLVEDAISSKLLASLVTDEGGGDILWPGQTIPLYLEPNISMTKRETIRGYVDLLNSWLQEGGGCIQFTNLDYLIEDDSVFRYIHFTENGEGWCSSPERTGRFTINSNCDSEEVFRELWRAIGLTHMEFEAYQFHAKPEPAKERLRTLYRCDRGLPGKPPSTSPSNVYKTEEGGKTFGHPPSVLGNAVIDYITRKALDDVISRVCQNRSSRATTPSSEKGGLRGYLIIMSMLTHLLCAQGFSRLCS
jgi:hypothetical protein